MEDSNNQPKKRLKHFGTHNMLQQVMMRIVSK